MVSIQDFLLALDFRQYVSSGGLFHIVNLNCSPRFPVQTLQVPYGGLANLSLLKVINGSELVPIGCFFVIIRSKLLL